MIKVDTIDKDGKVIRQKWIDELNINLFHYYVAEQLMAYDTHHLVIERLWGKGTYYSNDDSPREEP